MNCCTALHYLHWVLYCFMQLKRKISSHSLLFFGTKVFLYQSFSLSSDDVRFFTAIVALWVVFCCCIQGSFRTGYTTIHTNNRIMVDPIVGQLHIRRTRQVFSHKYDVQNLFVFVPPRSQVLRQSCPTNVTNFLDHSFCKYWLLIFEWVLCIKTARLLALSAMDHKANVFCGSCSYRKSNSRVLLFHVFKDGWEVLLGGVSAFVVVQDSITFIWYGIREDVNIMLAT